MPSKLSICSTYSACTAWRRARISSMRASCATPSAAVSSLMPACSGTRAPIDTERRSASSRERR
jgi:hypothetical protein